MSRPARCGIVLHPAGHTLSPVLHEAAYRALGLDARYEVFDVQPERLAAKLDELWKAGARQLSVSLPHKEAALALADLASAAAIAIGAANTLTARSGGVEADNTDWIGVLRTLEPLGPWRGRQATVLGAGGAARGVVYALRELGMDVVVVNRTIERARRLVSELGGRVGALEEPYDLLVNATSVGMHPDSGASPAPVRSIRRGCTVFDLVYRPLDTRLLCDARERGCRTQDGLEMLVHQAVEQVRLWSDRSPDPAELRRAAAAAVAVS